MKSFQLILVIALLVVGLQAISVEKMKEIEQSPSKSVRKAKYKGKIGAGADQSGTSSVVVAQLREPTNSALDLRWDHTPE